MTTFALIPAAGKSTRMGRPKLALPLGKRSVLEGVIGALHEAGVERILVVVGPHVSELVPLAEAAGAAVLRLAEETKDMRATVEHGWRWIEEHWRPSEEDYWLLVPADHPALDAAVVRHLLQAPEANPSRSIFLPAFEGRRGHPALLAWRHVAAMRALPAGTGLNVHLRRHAEQVAELPWASSDILLDLDTPEDYEQLLRRVVDGNV